ncbi:hypothetical protein [Rhizobium lusitanum]|uniref:Uncharacterized protein n=1 Tax=Rhizobium lusitanum TaxID=293958 RepID=A0A1C3VRL0_9HYPH|nr:hypothetical protein [Rhizobium lusitanum]SCB30339.1 hypothetical protein GA0061101_10695 [Rhizobium lusitanum]
MVIDEGTKPDDDLEIVVENDPLEITDIEVDAGKNAEGVEDWKVQLAAAQKEATDAKAKAVEAERLAQERGSEIERFQRENAQARNTAVSAEMMALDNAIANVEHERSDAKQKYRIAMEQGDFEAAAEAQSAMSEVAVKAQRMKEGKAALERRAEDVKHAVDPVEQFAASLSPQSGNWVRSHPDAIQNRSKLEKAHYGALFHDIKVDSPEYFKFLDQELGYTQRPAETVDTGVEIRRVAAAPAAPVSRGGAADAPQARGTNTVRLTAAQREIAALSGLTDAEYAKQLLAIQRENGTTH